MIDRDGARLSSAAKLDPREEHFRIPGPRAGMSLFLRYLPPRAAVAARDAGIVLYVHGATFSSASSIAHRFAGRSWRDVLAEAGFHVWGLDFYGFGRSDRYPEMSEPPDAHPPLCGTEDAARQIATVVPFILAHHEAPRLSIIAHSWGTIASCRFAGGHPALVDRLVLFGPIARRAPRRYEQPPAVPAWRIVTLADQWARFVEDVPKSEAPVLSRADFEEWGERYLDSDPDARIRTPAGVKVPTGPFADILRAWHGELAYDPARVRAPVALIRGEWDGLIPDEDARWLFDAFTQSPEKRDIKIGRGTHLLHLEAMRHALHRESIAFLGRVPP
ncbi:MAG TPA: alpha/beta fold hydrolase [Stellaceae bacterium]|nr:alpha/beta fold hydrolase [Stellaceae bacterium]